MYQSIYQYICIYLCACACVCVSVGDVCVHVLLLKTKEKEKYYMIKTVKTTINFKRLYQQSQHRVSFIRNKTRCYTTNWNRKTQCLKNKEAITDKRTGDNSKRIKIVNFPLKVVSPTFLSWLKACIEMFVPAHWNIKWNYNLLLGSILQLSPRGKKFF